MELKIKSLVGRVVSSKMNKTIVVAVDSTKRHRLYHKAVKVTRRYKAHDERNECAEGDVVKILEARPLSKEKRWRLGEIVIKKESVEIKPEEIK